MFSAAAEVEDGLGRLRQEDVPADSADRDQDGPQQGGPGRPRRRSCRAAGLLDRQRGVQVDVQRTEQQGAAGPRDHLRNELRIEEGRPEAVALAASRPG